MIVMCDCSGFEYWYKTDNEEDIIVVCECGHTTTEHLDGKGSCTGEIEIKGKQ